MGQFLYFLPGESSASPAVLKKYGIEDRFGGNLSHRGCSPAIKDGQLCAPGTKGATDVDGALCSADEGRRVRFDVKTQVWRAVEEPEKPVWYLGWYKDDMPGEADLARTEMPDGYGITLGDGEAWTVCVVKRYPDGSGLPATLKLNADGTQSEKVFARYRSLFDEVSEMADSYYDLLTKQKDGNLPDDYEPPSFSLELAYRILSVSYRVGRPEINELGLVTRAGLEQIALAVIDLPGFFVLASKPDEEQKKTG